MRTVLITICLLISATHTLAQKRWSQPATEDAQPKRPPDAICNDGTLFWQRLVDTPKTFCKGHKGVKQLVKNQFIEAGSDHILISKDAAIIEPLPLMSKIPDFWLHPEIKPAPKKHSLSNDKPIKPWGKP
jgi:hypothetical protein